MGLKKMVVRLIALVIAIQISLKVASAQAAGGDAARSTAFDRLDRTSMALLDALECVKQLAKARDRGLFGADSAAGPEYSCIRDSGKSLALLTTLDTTASIIRRLVALDRSTGQRFLGRLDTVRVLTELQAGVEAIASGRPSFDSVGRDAGAFAIRTDGDTLEVWLLPLGVLAGPPGSVLGGERGYIYAPDGKTHIRTINAGSKYRSVAIPDTGIVRLNSLEDELPLVTEMIAANRLNAVGRTVSIDMKKYLSSLGGGIGAQAIWFQIKKKTGS